MIERKFLLQGVVKISIDRRSQILFSRKGKKRTCTACSKTYFEPENYSCRRKVKQSSSALDYKTGKCSWIDSSFEWKCGQFGDASFGSRVRIVEFRTSPFLVCLQFLELRLFRARMHVVADLVIHRQRIFLEISM